MTTPLTRDEQRMIARHIPSANHAREPFGYDAHSRAVFAAVEQVVAARADTPPWQDLVPSTPTHSVTGEPIDLGEENDQWMNDQYVVIRSQPKSLKDRVRHLSIRRQDRQPCRDWRDFQRIKNQLAGPEWEAVEIYPAESRKVDGSNQYHLWCLKEQIGLGFGTRLVGTQEMADATAPGAVQRDPEEVDLRYGGLSDLQVMQEQNPPYPPPTDTIDADPEEGP